MVDDPEIFCLSFSQVDYAALIKQFEEEAAAEWAKKTAKYKDVLSSELIAFFEEPDFVCMLFCRTNRTRSAPNKKICSTLGWKLRCSGDSR